MKRSPLLPYSNIKLVFEKSGDTQIDVDAYGNPVFEKKSIIVTAYLKTTGSSEYTGRGGFPEHNVTLQGYITAPLQIPHDLLYNGAIASAMLEIESGVIVPGLFRVSQSYKNPALIKHISGIMLQPLRGLFTHK